MGDVICETVRADGVKAALPYVIIMAGLSLTVCALILFMPLLTLVRKIAISLGCIKVRSWYTHTHEYNDAPPDHGVRKRRGISQVIFGKHSEITEEEEFSMVDAPIPIHATEIQNPPSDAQESDPNPSNNAQQSGQNPSNVAHSSNVAHPSNVSQQFGQTLSNESQHDIPKVTVRTHYALVDTINTLVNANNTNYTIMLFLMMTIVLHLSLMVCEVGIRTLNFYDMLRTFEDARRAINASAATVEPLTTVINHFKEVAKP